MVDIAYILTFVATLKTVDKVWDLASDRIAAIRKSERGTFTLIQELVSAAKAKDKAAVQAKLQETGLLTDETFVEFVNKYYEGEKAKNSVAGAKSQTVGNMSEIHNSNISISQG